ncbi:MAG: glycoside hydrolase family protein, partial [Bacteroidota bacterium]|nr:glycoside hydrolase family protein [Bacteroidota bacterium]
TGTNKIKMPASMKDTLWWQYRNNQRIGVAVADNPEGEWERFDKPVIDVSKDSTAYDALLITNPAVTVDDKGRAVLVYKQVAKNGTLRGGKVRFGVAFSKSLLGPYTKYPKPIFEVSQGESSWMVAEDPYIWSYKGILYAIVTDVKGYFTDTNTALVLLRSTDGTDWEKTRYPKVAPLRLTFEDGRIVDDKLERPCLYCENGLPKILFGAHGFNKREWAANVAVQLEWKK